MNYALDSPLVRKMYVPGESETPFAPVTYPKPSTESDQTHRHLTWLFHKPQDGAIFPMKAKSARLDKKK